MTNPAENKIEIEISLAPSAQLPRYASPGAAGADVCACLAEPITLTPGSSALISTGVKTAIPQGYELQIRPRSGLALKHQVTVLNTPGTIDSDYRGEIGVILINHGLSDFTVTPGLRIAQFILAPVASAQWVPCEQLAETTRGSGGFGHTGTH